MQVLIQKSLRKLTLMCNEETLFCASIALGVHPELPKEREGDGRTPEGEYYICSRNPQSKFFLSLGISYPSPTDALSPFQKNQLNADQYEAIRDAWRNRRRPPWDTPLGGWIMIHGGGTDGDWTQGCVALENGDMQRLFDLCPLGTPVKIAP